MKRTAKFVAALNHARKVLPDSDVMIRSTFDNARLYDELEKAGHFWNAESGQLEDFKRSTSMFENDDSLPTGVVRLRLMSHPGDMDRTAEIVREALDTYGLKITEVSNKYPNRRGVGVRVYMTGQLPEQPKPAARRKGRQPK